MKNIFVLLLTAGVGFLAGGCATTPAKTVKQTYSSFDLPSEHVATDEGVTGVINFENVDVAQILEIYQKLSLRTVIHGPLPMASITFRSQAPLSRIEALQKLDTVLAENGIAMVLSGDNAVKAVPADRAVTETPPEITLPWQLLPQSDSCMSRTVRLTHLKPSQVVPLLAPLANLPNSIVAIDSEHLLILRDYSANIRQELKLLETLEKQPGR